MAGRTHIRNLIFFCVVLILVLAIVISGLHILESTVFFKGGEQNEPTNSKTIVRDGVAYFPRQDIKTMLVLGIDEYGPVKDSGSYNNKGEADMVSVVIFDEKNQRVDVLALNRDTMVNMPVLGIGGKQAGTAFGQLALSHTYGSGLEDSCENTRQTVSDLLYGISIDYYLAMNMDAISMMNDQVGGVTVEVTEDFSQVDPSIGMGEVRLTGEQALNYVRIRKDVGDQMNLSRMDRHKAYMTGFLRALQKSSQDEDFVLTAYNEVSPYIVTDCSAKVLSGMLSRYSDYTLGEVVTPAGENTLTETYYEFYADEEKLDALILRLFYAPK